MGLDPNNPDTDGDGIPDGLDDSDGDGIPDGVEGERRRGRKQQGRRERGWPRRRRPAGTGRWSARQRWDSLSTLAARRKDLCDRSVVGLLVRRAAELVSDSNYQHRYCRRTRVVILAA